MAASSMIVSLAVLIFGAVQYRGSARNEYVQELSARIDECNQRHEKSESARQECERERERLMRINIDLIADSRIAADRRLAEGRERDPPS